MKQVKSISKLLGLTQDQFAVILKVSRRQLSKHELGLGRLPQPAMERLEPIVEHIFGTEAKASALILQGQNDQKKHTLALMLKENEYQRAFTKRQLELAERKYHAKLKALQVVEFLSALEKPKGGNDDAMLRSIGHKASQSLKSNGLDLLLRLKIKSEMLELEKQLLEAEAQKQ
jgi:transcriptional regulator with XRE-family HTH domain